MMVDVYGLMGRYCNDDLYTVLVTHGEVVSRLALAICSHIGITDRDSLNFIAEASILHDIGVTRVNVPEIGAFGSEPYIRHGIIGKEILDAEGLPRHALVCERHIGVGLTASDILSQNLPLPRRDMFPRSVEEEIICYADLFFSKKPGKLLSMKDYRKVRQKLEKFGTDKIQIFDAWYDRFGIHSFLPAVR